MRTLFGSTRHPGRRHVVWQRAGRTLVSGQLLRALVLPLSVFSPEFAEPLVAPLAYGITLSGDGRILQEKRDGITLATIAGSALVNPTPPVTARGKESVRSAGVPRGTRFRILATGYSSTPDQTDSTPFITASGTHVHDGTIAVNFLSFGTKVRFPEYSGSMVYTVEDRHHPRLSDRADIWFPSRAAALTFGARVLQMEVVK